MKKHFHSIAIATALTFALPVAAFAADGDATQDTARKAKRGDEAKKKRERPSFPMKAETFMAHVDKRIARMKQRVDARLERSKLDDDAKAKIRAGVEAASTKVRSAAEKAGSDGTVTKDEAKQVRAVVREMREKARALRKEHKGKKPGARS